MKPALLSTFVAFCALLLSACGGMQTVVGPDGKMYDQLPVADNPEDHCRSVVRFVRGIYLRRSHPEIVNGKEIIVFHEKDAMRKDLDDELAGIVTFTEIGKRNYNKIISIFNRIVVEDEFSGKTPEQAGEAIYSECMEKMANKTWFPELASEAK